MKLNWRIEGGVLKAPGFIASYEVSLGSHGWHAQAKYPTPGVDGVAEHSTALEFTLADGRGVASHLDWCEKHNDMMQAETKISDLLKAQLAPAPKPPSDPALKEIETLREKIQRAKDKVDSMFSATSGKTELAGKIAEAEYIGSLDKRLSDLEAQTKELAHRRFMDETEKNAMTDGLVNHHERLSELEATSKIEVAAGNAVDRRLADLEAKQEEQRLGHNELCLCGGKRELRLDAIEAEMPRIAELEKANELLSEQLRAVSNRSVEALRRVARLEDM